MVSNDQTYNLFCFFGLSFFHLIQKVKTLLYKFQLVKSLWNVSQEKEKKPKYQD